MKNIRNLLLVLLAALALPGCSGFSSYGQEFEIRTVSAAPKETDPAEPAQIVAYICGEVARPGVYTLDEAARIEDLVNAAGGALQDADLSRINLAQKLADGQQVVVYPKTEENGGAGGTVSSGKVNLNLADKEDLMTLPGVGESRAESILAYREEIGWFQSPEEIMNISGIKEKMYEKIADLIEV